MLSLLVGQLRRHPWRRGHDLESSLEWMFERARFGRIPTEQVCVAGVPPAPRAYRRLDRVESVLADISELRLELPVRSWLSITGAETDRYSSVLWLETASEESAAAIAERTELRRQGETFVLGVPEELLAEDVVFRWEMVAPRQRPVTISCADAAIGVYDMAGAVKISAGHGHVLVLESSGATHIKTMSGDAVWAGCHGPVHIDAESGIHLKVTERTFNGTLHATSAQSIHVWLPHGCAAAIEADVAHDNALVCRADLVRMKRREENDRVVFTYGAGQPQLRLISLEGSVVVDTYRDDGVR